ncbi:protocatechuate 3,4-dioxygenase [Undibacterium arcticum]|uniref:Protocatechuate 3,4-dioxygenase n=1 Tax=Undibacterium arcticum TaxID=1762892 RepID=A0ABV7FAQ8_9BURK
MASKITTTQTIGPFPHEAWRWGVNASATLVSSAPTISISGVIRDGNGNPISDGWIEAWLPDAVAAEFAQAIPGFRRIPTDDDGAFRIEVSLPTPATAGKPVLYATIFARGLVKHQFTAVFLEDDTGLPQSEILKQVPDYRRETLIARKQADAQYHWDIWMQTDKETVFFDYV